MGNAKLTIADKKIILGYAKNDMVVSRTASDLCYHRNAIEYHLTRVKREIGLDPHNFYDLIKLVDIVKEGDNS